MRELFQLGTKIFFTYKVLSLTWEKQTALHVYAGFLF